MSRALFVLQPAPHPARARALEAVRTAPEGYVVEVRQKTRSLEQNALMWSMLAEISQRVCWHGEWLTAENWKDVFTAALKREKVVPGIGGGFVVLGQHTSRMTRREMGDLIELMHAFAAEQGVAFPWETPPRPMPDARDGEVPR
ncbi:recombination protein NinB [Methylomagnum ishizawai]|uniref:recombination protein NinB n=1 Tax=Methylomagnum ishizawai TaxID=1760988 RepID=UPI001C3328BC|nr:recombination protein NinB [Methylomagnum ishizawai]BBL73189.1 protein ninB [Methylomagnum ishizawai]